MQVSPYFPTAKTGVGTVPAQKPPRFLGSDGEKPAPQPPQPTAPQKPPSKARGRVLWAAVIALAGFGLWGQWASHEAKKETETLQRFLTYTVAEEIAPLGVRVGFFERDGKTWFRMRGEGEKGPVAMEHPVEKVAGFLRKTMVGGYQVTQCDVKPESTDDVLVNCLHAGLMAAELEKFPALQPVITFNREAATATLNLPEGKQTTIHWQQFVLGLPALQALAKTTPHAGAVEVVAVLAPAKADGKE